MGVSTLDADYLPDALANGVLGKPRPSISDAKLDKRGLLSFAFDGRYKFARYYAPTAFNAPQTLEDIFRTTTFSCSIFRATQRKCTIWPPSRRRIGRCSYA
jgi:hypothetical protein